MALIVKILDSNGGTLATGTASAGGRIEYSPKLSNDGQTALLDTGVANEFIVQIF